MQLCGSLNILWHCLSLGLEWKLTSSSKSLIIIIMSLLEYNHYISGEGNCHPTWYSCLENPMDGGAWKVAVHGVAESQTRLSDFTFTFYFHALEKEMATHSNVPAWRIPGMGEPGGLPSVGSHRVGHDWSDLAAAAPLERSAQPMKASPKCL